MDPLRDFTLSYSEAKEEWDLKKDLSGQTVKSFGTKEEATKGGVLKETLGQEGGSVKIQKQNGVYQEERTFPRSRDPKESKG